LNDPIPEPLRGADVISWAQPVTRALNALSDKVGATARNERDRRAPTVLPWSFSCVIDPETDERTGGWTNCRLQVGFDYWTSDDIYPMDFHDHSILGADTCDDGTHYLEITLANGTEGRENDTVEIKVAAEGTDVETVPESDYVNGIIRLKIGTIVDGKLQEGRHMNPVVYKYL
jgi:hypothetical protein